MAIISITQRRAQAASTSSGSDLAWISSGVQDCPEPQKAMGSIDAQETRQPHPRIQNAAHYLGTAATGCRKILVHTVTLAMKEKEVIRRG